MYMLVYTHTCVSGCFFFPPDRGPGGLPGPRPGFPPTHYPGGVVILTTQAPKNFLPKPKRMKKFSGPFGPRIHHPPKSLPPPRVVMLANQTRAWAPRHRRGGGGGV